MLNRLLAFVIVLLASFAVVSAQDTNAPAPRYAIISSGSMTHPRYGILDFSKLENFVEKNILPAEKESRSASKDAAFISPRSETVARFLLILQRRNNIVFLALEDFSGYTGLLAVNQSFFITEKIVEFANSMSEKSDGKFNLKVPDGQIALVNNDRLWDARSGVPRLAALVREHGSQDEVCKRTKVCLEMGKAFQRFAAKKGFGLIIDRSKPLPELIQPFPLTDQTDEFMADFQKKK